MAWWLTAALADDGLYGQGPSGSSRPLPPGGLARGDLLSAPCSGRTACARATTALIQPPICAMSVGILTSAVPKASRPNMAYVLSSAMRGCTQQFLEVVLDLQLTSALWVEVKTRPVPQNYCLGRSKNTPHRPCRGIWLSGASGAPFALRPVPPLPRPHLAFCRTSFCKTPAARVSRQARGKLCPGWRAWPFFSPNAGRLCHSPLVLCVG